VRPFFYKIISFSAQISYNIVTTPKMKFIKPSSIIKKLGFILLLLIILGAIVFSLPTIIGTTINQGEGNRSTTYGQFPVTVDPKTKTIVENEKVDDFFESASSPLQAAVGGVVWNTLEWLATTIADTPWYQSVAFVNGRFITITPGMRKEQAASAFTKALAWNSQEKKEFTTPKKDSTLPLPEGSFSPGIYFMNSGTAPSEAQAVVNNRFTEDVLSHYGTSTAEIVPLDEALTIASLIQRETGGSDDMRLISGIIWNRIFTNMNLQIDATLQYAKANNTVSGSWWPTVLPSDKYRKSPYNTYIHAGLPPTPISNPSVAAIVAALNPKKTSCLFYFHDKDGEFHCADTYEEHVKLLKKYYGQGK
jgi:hypothetical protein